MSKQIPHTLTWYAATFVALFLATLAASATEVAPAASTPTAIAAIAARGKAPAEITIVGDTKGQWASAAKASSTYASSPAPKAAYSAWQATGAPNVPRYADHPGSWAPKSGDAPMSDWLEVGFARAVYATSIRVRQNAAPGAVSRIELIDETGDTHILWEGTDTTRYEKNAIGWFIRDFPRTDYMVKGARITLATGRVWGWNEIDAVQLVGENSNTPG